MSSNRSAISAFIRVAQPNDPVNDLFLNLNVNNTTGSTDPIDVLQGLFDDWLTSAGLDNVIAAGSEFGLPVGINGTRDFKRRYAQGVRLFFDIGPAYAASGPSLSPEDRKAVGR